MGVKLIACVIAGAAVAAAAQSGSTAPQTTRDKVYSKAQAARGAATYEKLCASCHDPAKAAAGKDPGPALVGEKFVGEWLDRTLGGLMETTLLTMPNDGSAVLSESDTADVIAHILQANGYADGPADLKYDAGKDIVIVK
ncbi:MAG TPA: cytochrome c [Vicinamibacterales bacterium]|nr:cytochrome c [Vicinamibacterales bacterium]